MSVTVGKSTQVTAGVHGGTTAVYDLIFGQVDPHQPAIGPEMIVNPAEREPTGWGPDNLQQFQSSHTNALPTNQSAEQGFGVGPERRWAHYPHVEQPNPFRNLNVFQRDGGDSYSANVYRPEVVAYWANALAHEAFQQPHKQTSPVNPVENQAVSVPYVATIPVIMPGGY